MVTTMHTTPSWQGGMTIAQCHMLHDRCAGYTADGCWLVPEWVHTLTRKVVAYREWQAQQAPRPRVNALPPDVMERILVIRQAQIERWVEMARRRMERRRAA